MTHKQWYERLFDNYGKRYDSESFTKGTIAECDFLERELSYNKSLKILDIGCGTGRHSIELAARGYKMTGIDLSDSMLERARAKLASRSVVVEFLKQDARNLPFEKEFDAAIMMCEGAFPLMESDEMNYEILKSAGRSLKDKCKFIFTTLNGLFPIYHSVEKFLREGSGQDNATYRSNSFDLMTFRDHNITEITDDDGNRISLECNERYYIPSEITWLMKSLGFKKTEIFGVPSGSFSREMPLTTEDFEMLVISERW